MGVGMEETRRGTALPAVCLGCGCVCDDLQVGLQDGRVVVGGEPPCRSALTWYRAWRPDRTARVDGTPVSIDTALAEASRRLTGLQRPVVYLAPDLSCEALGEAIGIADWLGWDPTAVRVL